MQVAGLDHIVFVLALVQNLPKWGSVLAEHSLTSFLHLFPLLIPVDEVVSSVISFVLSFGQRPFQPPIKPRRLGVLKMDDVVTPLLSHSHMVNELGEGLGIVVSIILVPLLAYLV